MIDSDAGSIDLTQDMEDAEFFEVGRSFSLFQVDGGLLGNSARDRVLVRLHLSSVVFHIKSLSSYLFLSRHQNPTATTVTGYAGYDIVSLVLIEALQVLANDHV